VRVEFWDWYVNDGTLGAGSVSSILDLLDYGGFGCL
jgi:hypothetical protein